ncbi:MAG: DUF3102 domain-containing protein [Burkholderiales bacterium]|nr:DUF3102 domain-containing protein [Burkholderiales bacterium]
MTDTTMITRTTLAGEIREHHRQVQVAVRAGLTHAREAGRLLADARAQVSHGGWATFVEQDCGLSRSTAAGYVRIFRRWGELEPYVQRVAHLPLRRALALLAAPRPDAAPVGDATHAAIGVVRDDGREQVAYLHPSSDDAFIYYAIMTQTIGRADDATVDGGVKPIRREWAFRALAHAGFPVAAATWKASPAPVTPWTFNEWLFDSAADYRHALVTGQVAHVDHPIIGTSPDEHRAYIQAHQREG